MQGRPGGALQRGEVAGVAPGRLPCGLAGQNRPAPRAWHRARRGPGRSCDPRHCGADGFIAGKHSLAGVRELGRRRGPTLRPRAPPRPAEGTRGAAVACLLIAGLAFKGPGAEPGAQAALSEGGLSQSARGQDRGEAGAPEPARPLPYGPAWLSSCPRPGPSLAPLTAGAASYTIRTYLHKWPIKDV